MTRRKSPARASAFCELGHAECELFVVCGRTGPPVDRPTITVAFDRCARKFNGIYIGSDPANVRTVTPLAGGAA